jgi:hypothetical protein
MFHQDKALFNTQLKRLRSICAKGRVQTTYWEFSQLLGIYNSIPQVCRIMGCPDTIQGDSEGGGGGSFNFRAKRAKAKKSKPTLEIEDLTLEL